jgi:two-component system nitrogen regulation sensor histidine kinase NtrY
VILGSIATGVISTDHANCVSAVNRAAERILGVTGGALAGKTAEGLAGEGVHPELFSRLSGGAGDDEGPSEADIVRGGERRTIKYMRTEMNTEGRYLGAVFVFDDLTELIDSKKLSAWVEMARQIAHEIKNPLTPIKLSTQFMVRAHQEKSSDFDRIFSEGSETIMQQVDVLRNIASEFSSFGRLQQLHLAPHRIAPVLDEIVSPYRRNAAGVAVSLDLAANDPRAVVDPEALRKICTNLIENAMEAMSGGGELRVECGEAAIDGRRFLRVSFCDTGAGLSDDVKEHLFEPYFSTKTTGTGLGLAICRSLSREMGGEVTLENRPEGRGVRATLYLRPA